jgi:soluble cytochrome b562
MLVKFDSEAGQILMFGDVAVALLKMMGQSGVVPGAIVAAEIPSALEKLRQGVEAQAHHPRARRDDETEEPDVTLRQRAVPLIELLDRAAKQGKNVMWTQEPIR